MEFMEYKKLQYSKVPMILSDAVAPYNDLERLDTLFLIGRYKGIKKEITRKDITDTEAHILTICKLISDNNFYLLTHIGNVLGVDLRG
jgi:hypothetical protein